MNPKRIFKNIFLSLLLVFVCLSISSAQITIQDINWQLSDAVGRKRLSFVKVKGISVKPDGKINEKIRIIVSVANKGEKTVEGLVIRYALNFRMVNLKSPGDTAIWSVPFRIEELRISKIEPSRASEVKIIKTGINKELKKLRNNGFWINAIGLEIMIEPKKGDDLKKIIYQSSIAVKR